MASSITGHVFETGDARGDSFRRVNERQAKRAARATRSKFEGFGEGLCARRDGIGARILTPVEFLDSHFAGVFIILA